MKAQRLETLYKLLLIKGHFITERPNINGTMRYCIFSPPRNPLMIVTKSEYNYLSKALIKVKNIEVISRQAIRQRHGKSYLKSIYLKLLNSHKMNTNDVDNIVKTFMSKAPAEYYMNASKLTHNKVTFGGIHLFKDDSPNSDKVASLMIKGIDAQHMSVELIIGNDAYDICDNPAIMIGLINQLVPYQGLNAIKHDQKATVQAY